MFREAALCNLIGFNVHSSVWEMVNNSQVTLTVFSVAPVLKNETLSQCCRTSCMKNLMMNKNRTFFSESEHLIIEEGLISVSSAVKNNYLIGQVISNSARLFFWACDSQETSCT